MRRPVQNQLVRAAPCVALAVSNATVSFIFVPRAEHARFQNYRLGWAVTSGIPDDIWPVGSQTPSVKAANGSPTSHRSAV